MPPSPHISILFLPPPSPSIPSYTPQHLSALALTPEVQILTSPPLPAVPSLFLSALRVRIPVFVHEQHCSLEGEIDADDVRSWHWVAFDQGAKGEDDGNGSGDEGKGKAVGALRLVPPSPKKDHERQEEGEKKDEQGRPIQPNHHPTSLWDGREPYVQLGRMATLSEYRGCGVAKQLLNAAMDWAGQNKDKFRVEGADEDGDGDKREGWRGLVLSHAQRNVRRWYEKMGFVEDDGLGVWWEEGIEHVGMWKRV